MSEIQSIEIGCADDFSFALNVRLFSPVIPYIDVFQACALEEEAYRDHHRR